MPRSTTEARYGPSSQLAASSAQPSLYLVERPEQIDALQQELHRVITRFRQEFDHIENPEVCWALECVKQEIEGIDIDFESEEF